MRCAVTVIIVGMAALRRAALAALHAAAGSTATIGHGCVCVDTLSYSWDVPILFAHDCAPLVQLVRPPASAHLHTVQPLHCASEMPPSPPSVLRPPLQCLTNAGAAAPRRQVVRMGNKATGGPFAPLVVVVRNVIGEKEFNKLRGKAISLHSQSEFGVIHTQWIGGSSSSILVFLCGLRCACAHELRQKTNLV